LTDDEALALLKVLKLVIVLGDQYFFPCASSLPGYDNPVHGVHFLRGIQEVRVGIRTTEDLFKIGQEELDEGVVNSPSQSKPKVLC
jgi:hypothetical protein